MGRALYPQDLRSTSVDSDQAQGAPSPTDAPNNPFAGLDGPQVRPFWSGANSSVLETLEPRAAQRPPAPHPTAPRSQAWEVSWAATVISVEQIGKMRLGFPQKSS